MPSPIVTATVQATVLSGVSNVLGQTFDAYRSNRPITLHFDELLRFVLVTVITAPPNYRWQQLLERTFPAYGSNHADESLPMTRLDTNEYKDKRRHDEDGTRDEPAKRKLNIKNTLLKWFIDCISLGALVNTVLFLGIMGLLKGQDWTRIQHNVQTQTIPLIVAGYRIWPIASIISFSFIPVEKRVVFFSLIGLGWGVYMSLVAAKV